jgi:tetratricopeptide (TPR) repeat protein
VTKTIEETHTNRAESKPAWGLAVSELEGTKRTPLGVVEARELEDRTWSLRCLSDESQALDKLRSVVESYSQARKVSVVDSSTIQPDVLELESSIREQGFAVEDISSGDRQINFQIDLERGLMVATDTALHASAPSDDKIGRRIFASIVHELGEAQERLSAECEAMLDRNEVRSALDAIRSAQEKGIFSLPSSKKLLNTLIRFRGLELSRDNQRLVLNMRMMLAHQLGRFEVAGDDAEVLLDDDANDLSVEITAALRMTVALGAIKSGHNETGLSILRELLSPPSKLDATGRGWAWRNIALTLSKTDPEARRAAQLSADSFLEAGDRQAAAKSMMHLANLLMEIDPTEAVARLDEMMGFLGSESLLDQRVRASALHSRANRYSRLNKHQDAFRDACEAVGLQRGLLGGEEFLVSSLHLAAIEARHVGDQIAADAFEKEAEVLTEELKLPHFHLADRVSHLADNYDSTDAKDLLSAAEAQNNLTMIAAVRVLQAAHDQSLSEAGRLRILEEVRNRILSARGDVKALKHVQFAIGQLLARSGNFDRAESWFREILNADALDGHSRDQLISCLWRQEKWGDAVIFLRKQLALRGELPGLSYALGKSQFEAGDMSGAVTTLSRVIFDLGCDENIRKNATEVRERALRLGGTIQARRAASPVGTVTRAEFERAMDDFGNFISAEKRMRFWDGDGRGGYRWSPRPEARAQDLLHTFIKARFVDRIEIFEEVGTGAGRLDLYVRAEGGLGIIVELKMCGDPYSTIYAASGEEQIKHYMDNRQTRLGYLVVFDARVKLYGQRLLSFTAGPHTIIEKIVDVRNRVKSSE